MVLRSVACVPPKAGPSIAEMHVDQPGRQVRCWRTLHDRLKLLQVVQLCGSVLLASEPSSVSRALEHDPQRVGRLTLACGLLQFVKQPEQLFNRSTCCRPAALVRPDGQLGYGNMTLAECLFDGSKPTRGDVDNSRQGRTICRAVRQAEIGDDVSNLGPPKEVRVGAHAKGQARRAKSQRNRPGLRVGPKEDSNLTRMLDLSGVEKTLDLGSHEKSLIQLITCGIDSSARPLCIAGPGFTATLEWGCQSIAQRDDNTR